MGIGTESTWERISDSLRTNHPTDGLNNERLSIEDASVVLGDSLVHVRPGNEASKQALFIEVCSQTG